MDSDILKYNFRDEKIVELHRVDKKPVSLALTKKFEDLATTYIDMGYSVTPIIFKAPYLSKWQTLKEEEVLSKTWHRGANGIGILTGEVNNLICLDIDIEDPKNELRLELERRLPPIFCAKEGNPLRPPARFFKYNYEVNRKFNNIGVEILSDGNQTVLPGSLHDKYEKEYRWIGKSLLNIDVDDLPDLPSDIIPWLIEQNKKTASKKIKKLINGKQVLVSASMDKTITTAKGRCYHGSYNNISMLCVSLAKEGHNLEYIYSKANELDFEINATADYKFFECPKRPEFRGLTYNEALETFVEEIFYKYSPNPFNLKKVFNQKAYEYFRPKIARGFTTRTINEKGKETITREYKTLYKFFRSLHKADYLAEMKMFAIWNGKHYEYKSEDFIKQFVQRYFKDPEVTNIGERSKFLELVKNCDQADISKYTLKDIGKINLENGILDINSLKLTEHNADFKMMNIVPTSYVEKSECPIWDKLLENVCMNDLTKQKAIEEFIGYALSAADYNKFNKILILDGGGSNGKSTIIRIIKNLIGADNCSAVDPTDIATNRFAAYSMFNKMVNFCSEVGREAFLNTGALKKITGGDPIMLEAKNKGAIAGNINAKFIISYNKMPYFPDTSEGMRRRLLLIRLDQNFETRPDLKIANVENKIMAELPGVLLRCVNAYREVMERGQFTEPNGGMERLDEMVEASNPIVSFFNERLDTGADGFISNEMLKEEFIAFCDDKGEKLKKIGPYKLVSEIIELAKQHQLKKLNVVGKDAELQLIEANKKLHFSDGQGLLQNNLKCLVASKISRGSKFIASKAQRGVIGLYKKSAITDSNEKCN